MRRTPLLLGASLLALAICEPAFAGTKPRPKPVSEAAVRACVQENLVRYTGPEKATFAQYVDLATACRAALSDEEDAELAITPLGANGDARRGGESPANGRGGGMPPAPLATASPRPRPARADGKHRGRGANARVAAKRPVRTAPRSELPLVRQALDGRAPDRPAADALAAGSRWLTVLFVVALLLTSLGAVFERRRRTRGRTS